MTEEITAVLVINRSDSLCTQCGRGCLPWEACHKTMAGYIDYDKPGCGAKFIAVSTNYYGMDDSVKQYRPDLPFMGWTERKLNGYQ